MSSTALRYYHTTISYRSTKQQRRMRDVAKLLRTRVSRRRVKQQLSRLIHEHQE